MKNKLENWKNCGTHLPVFLPTILAVRFGAKVLPKDCILSLKARYGILPGLVTRSSIIFI